MPLTCRDLSRSFEHETFCALANRANRRGVVSDAADAVSRLLGQPLWLIREAIDTLLDAGYLERLGPGIYRLETSCSCSPENVFSVSPVKIEESNTCSPKGKAGSMRQHGASTSAATEGSQQTLPFISRRLSRSLPKNQPAQNSFHGLVYYFKQRCDEEGFSPRQWNPSALRLHFSRWEREGIGVDIARQMIDAFVVAYAQWAERPRTVAWKLFVYEKEALLGKVATAPPKQDAALERMRRAHARRQAELAAI